MLLREICSTSYKEMLCNSYTVISEKAIVLYTSLCAMGTMRIWTIHTYSLHVSSAHTAYVV